jgi:hypothetical protein
METIKEVITSPYKGSEATYAMVKKQLLDRYGEKVANEYDPRFDCAPFSTWAAAGFRIKRGEHALKSVTYVEIKNDEGVVERKVRRNCNLFHRCQLERVS